MGITLGVSGVPMKLRAREKRLKSIIELSGARIRANSAAIRATAGSSFEVLAVVKADAYGHGAALVSPVLVEAGVRWLGVGDLEEGVQVRRALQMAGLEGHGVHLVVMCGFEPEDASGIVAAKLTPVLWTVAQAEALEMAASAAQVCVNVHLELDTGMARQGALPGPELAAILKKLRSSPHIRCEGVFSHLSSSEREGSTETARQQALFQEALDQVYSAEVCPAWVHLGNSSAGDEGSAMDWMRSRVVRPGASLMWRPGLALYGYVLPLEPGAKTGQLQGRLEPVATWKTRVIGVREISAGAPVGYGATFVAARPMRLALLPVGYADGFRREASSGVGDGWVMIAGLRAPVVGRVSMNLTVADVTRHGGVREGDEVVLLGEGVTAEDHALWCGTIAYEILCGMRGHRRLI